MRLNRGVVNIAVIVILVVAAALAVPAYHVVKDIGGIFNPDGHAKTQVTQLVAAQQTVTAIQAKVDVKSAQIDTAKQARLDVGTQDVVGTGFALAKEKNPSANVKVAIVLNNAAYKAQDPIDQSKIDEMQKLVDQAVSKDQADQDAANAKIAAMQTQVDTARASEAGLRKDKAVLVTQLTTAKATVSSLQTSVTKWASDNASLLSRIGNLTMWLTILGVVLLALHWILPLIGMAFPAAAPLAKGLAALVAYPLHALHTAEKAVLSKAITEGKQLISTTETKLTSEIAAHAQTQATLVKVATSP